MAAETGNDSINKTDSLNKRKYFGLSALLSGLLSKIGLRGFYHRFVDKVEGIDTAGDIWQTGNGFNSDIARKYGPGGWWDLKLTLGNSISNEDVFIDFGSGKGRMVYLAARHFPFKKVIGVELSENLNVIARENIRRNRTKLRCKDVQIVASNVADYTIPDDVTVVYFYDPFRDSLFSELIGRLKESCEKHPRDLRIVYRNPVMHEAIVGKGFMVVIKKPSLTMYKYPGT